MEFNVKMDVPGSVSGGRWQPMRRSAIHPVAQQMAQQVDDAMDEVWVNDAYECQVRYLDKPLGREGGIHLSIKLKSRDPIRDWRHLQSIKNEVAGPEREAFELYPRESRLVDTSNQFHLWVLPANMELPMGYTERIVGTRGDMVRELRRRGMDEDFIRRTAKARQRDWQPGLSTGPNYNGGQ